MGRRSYCKGLLLVLLLLQSGCYLITQGYYQAELLCGARPVEKIIKDPKTSEHDRNKLLLIGEIRKFSISNMSMHASANYSTINPKWDRNLYVVSACKELSFEPYIWTFPIVGKVPYLGHFNETDATKEERSLKKKGFDTMLRSVAAYSSLGYFNDPIWPQMLKRSSHSLAELILHELAHATLYFSGQTDFNESFANFVGRTGALQFLQYKYGSKSEELSEAILFNSDDEKYEQWISALHDQLDKLYSSQLSDDEKRFQKAQNIGAAKESFKGLGFRSEAFKDLTPPELNNATLKMSESYNTNQDDFEKLYQRVNGNWNAFYERLKTLQHHPHPFEALKRLLE